MPPDAPDALYAEEIGLVYRQMPMAVAVNLVNAALTAAVLTPVAQRPAPVLWFGALALVNAGRWLLWRRHRLAAPPPEHARRWSLPATGGALLAGLGWGVGGALMLAELPATAQIFLTFVVGGMCAGAVVVNAAHLPALLSFLLAAAVPLAIRFLIQETQTDMALGVMILIFAGALSLAGTRLHRVFAETLRLRFELTAAAARLEAEIADRRATEAALRQAQKLEAIGRLTGGIAHDFNNLLTVVIGNLALAERRLDEPGGVAPLLQGALRAAERGVGLIQRLLAFARQQRLTPRSVDLSLLLAGIDDLLRRSLGPDIALVVHAGESIAAARVDPDQLELAILNLAINARDAMPDGGTLLLTLENRPDGGDAPAELAAGAYVVLSIVDDGTGMDEAVLAQAFDPFFTTKEVGAGSGLGLPMVQGFAAQSGGAVRIRSRNGAGTTVELWLPQADKPVLREPARMSPAATSMPSAGAKILLCDDDDDVRRFLASFLEDAGYAVHQAEGAGRALRILESAAAIDLFVIDYAMPEMNGLETIRQAWRRRPGLKPLLITGHPAAWNGEMAGVTVLRKPFTPQELARQVAAMLAGSSERTG
jgi:signal transduction histidine kinase/CheY-like chemotaxis protein